MRVENEFHEVFLGAYKASGWELCFTPRMKAKQSNYYEIECDSISLVRYISYSQNTFHFLADFTGTRGSIKVSDSIASVGSGVYIGNVFDKHTTFVGTISSASFQATSSHRMSELPTSPVLVKCITPAGNANTANLRTMFVFRIREISP